MATVIAIAIAGSLAAAYAFHFLGLGATNCGATPTYQPGSAHLTIAMDNQGVNVGFNGSKYHSLPWPIVNTTQGQTVFIHVINNDPTQPHGFAITHYLDSGITLRPRECYNLTFTANQAGNFTMFCNIFCTIHVYMQDGRLSVK